jgi:hypothetical protein
MMIFDVSTTLSPLLLLAFQVRKEKKIADTHTARSLMIDREREREREKSNKREKVSLSLCLSLCVCVCGLSRENEEYRARSLQKRMWIFAKFFLRFDAFFSGKHASEDDTRRKNDYYCRG